MMSAYQIESICKAFGAASEQFEFMLSELAGRRSAQLEHGEVESLIWQMAMELNRRLLQGYLNLRAAGEVRREDVTGPDGQLLTRCRKNCKEKLMSVFGGVTVRRLGYSSPGVKSRFTLNCDLNLPEDNYSHGLRRRVAEEVANNSFDQAVASIRTTTGGKVPKRQTEEVTVSVAQDFEAFYSKRESCGPEPSSDILAMSVDQKGVVMHKEDLREATRKAAEECEQRSGARLAPGEKPNRKRMATVAAVHSIKPNERSPEMIMGKCEDSKENRHRATNKRVWASVEQESEKVIEAMFNEALRRDPEKKRLWAVLLDGAEKQLDLALGFILRYRPDAYLILDFIHVLEYVWKAAHCFHAAGSKEAEQWVAERALKILQGQSASVAIEIRRGAATANLGSKKRKPIIKCAEYLEKYEILLDYPTYLKKGLPIATGVIEGACRHLVKDRMDLTGARWRLKSAEAVLRLRSLKSSGDLDSYWSFHLKQERERNYPSMYACSPQLQEAV